MKIKYTTAKIHSPSMVMQLTQMKLNGKIEDFKQRKGLFLVSFVVTSSVDGHNEFKKWLKRNKIQ